MLLSAKHSKLPKLMLNKKISSLFAPDGALATHIPNFRARPQQVEMAEAIAEAIAANGLLIAEAGTGTGKTFAYLVPALLAGGKVVLSTGTKNLQDQLFQRDLPTVRDALKAPVSIALLKGRANYVCHYHLERAQSDGRFATREDARHLAKIVQYAKITQTGDKSGLAGVPETAAIWMQVTSTRENCLGQECPSHKECFVLKARKEAMEADVVVVNHHLFFAATPEIPFASPAFKSRSFHGPLPVGPGAFTVDFRNRLRARNHSTASAIGASGFGQGQLFCSNAPCQCYEGG